MHPGASGRPMSAQWVALHRWCVHAVVLMESLGITDQESLAPPGSFRFQVQSSVDRTGSVHAVLCYHVPTRWCMLFARPVAGVAAGDWTFSSLTHCSFWASSSSAWVQRSSAFRLGPTDRPERLYRTPLQPSYGSAVLRHAPLRSIFGWEIPMV